MALPKRHRRSITCDGRAYHWYLPQGRDVDHRSDYHLIVQEAKGKGQILKVRASYGDAALTFIAEGIAEALAKGWLPDEPGKPFTLTRPSEEA